uniref:trypsin n=1 Tax=Oryzias latipes TaxID=8090 RepID=A0A3P9JGZ8_ORYLA
MTVTRSCGAFMCTLVVLSGVETVRVFLFTLFLCVLKDHFVFFLPFIFQSLWKPNIWGRFTDLFSSGGFGGLCLNGGSSVPSLITGEHLFCVCPEGFAGIHCETEVTNDCYEGVGLYYRGQVSETASGRACAEWDPETRRRFLSWDLHSGRHNYCRNLHFRRRPWCYVGKNHQLQWEYCEIPRCGFQPVASEPSPEPTQPLTTEELTCGQRTRGRQMKIVGGTVSSVESHPWMAAIFWRSKSEKKIFRCGGSLISACWVLTAAHCFLDGSRSRARHFSVTLGKSALNESNPDTEQTFKVDKIFIHEGFDNSDGNYNNDIALLKLKPKRGRCAEESAAVKPVCLPPPAQTLHPGFPCQVSGFGKERHELWYNSQYLREAQVNILADDVCRREDYYGNMITDNMICAASPNWSQDACKGDSGGPLVCAVAERFFLFGVVSWGDGCAEEFRPGVYTKVNNYNKWIAEKTGLSAITARSEFPPK